MQSTSSCRRSTLKTTITWLQWRGGGIKGPLLHLLPLEQIQEFVKRWTYNTKVELGGIRPGKPLCKDKALVSKMCLRYAPSEPWLQRWMISAVSMRRRGGGLPVTISIITKNDRLASEHQSARSWHFGALFCGSVALPRDSQDTLLSQCHLHNTFVPACGIINLCCSNGIASGFGIPLMTFPTPIAVLKSPRPLEESNLRLRVRIRYTHSRIIGRTAGLDSSCWSLTNRRDCPYIRW